MLRVGLTGGIGSGKTTVAQILEVLGIPVYYADEASKKLYHTDAELISSLKKHFGEDLYQNGILDRQKLATKVFSDPLQLQLLNKLVHPPTIRDAENWMKSQTGPYIVKEAALIFESGSSASLDYVVGVRAPLSLRIKRVMERNKVSRDEVLQRINRQIDEDIKMKLCDEILINDEQVLLLPQVLALHQKLIQLAQKA